MKSGILCQVCGVEAPTKHIEFHRNIGALIMRFHSKVGGQLCKSCIHQKFWSMTGTTVAVGWLGLISLIIAPIFVLNNIIQYIGALGMPAVPPDAKVPKINQENFALFSSHSQQFFDRVKRGEDPADAAVAMAPELAMTPGQVLVCLQVLIQQQRAMAAEQSKRTGGFPVIPKQPTPGTPPPLPPMIQ